MRTDTGIIIAVQEGRFRLAGADGVPRPYMLGHGAGVEPQDLPALQRSGTRVTIRFTPSSRLTAGIVHTVTFARPGIRGDRA